MTEAAVALGARLKAERERRGLSSAKTADELHLDGWVVDALEAEDYERIGPAVYAKGHLKRYASLLGLPPDEILAVYESRTQAPKTPAAAAGNVRAGAAAPAVRNLSAWQVSGFAVLVLLVLGVLVWKPWHERGAASASVARPSKASGSVSADTPADSVPSTTAAASAAPAARPATPAAAPSPGATSTMTTAAATVANTAANTAARVIAAAPSHAPADPAAGTGRARLRLSFSADSWVDVHDASGRRTFAGKGRANSVKVLHGVAPMRVYLGFASGVQLEINDRAVAIGPQFVAGDVARFEAGADGILRRDSR